MGIFKVVPLRVKERKRTGLSAYRILTVPVGAVMEGQLKRLAANKEQGCGVFVCGACVFGCVCIHSSEVMFVLINYHQYTCLCL